VDNELVGKITGKDAAAIRRVAREAVYRIDAEGAANRAKERRKNRKVELFQQDDGMATLSGYLPAETATGAYARIDAIAQRLKKEQQDQDRSMDELRADVFEDLLLGKHSDSTGSGIDNHGGGVAAQIFIHM